MVSTYGRTQQRTRCSRGGAAQGGRGGAGRLGHAPPGAGARLPLALFPLLPARSPLPRPLVTRGGGVSREVAARTEAAGGGREEGGSGRGRRRRRVPRMRWRLLWLLCAAGWWGAGGKTLRGGFASASARLEPWRPVARFQFHGGCLREGGRRGREGAPRPGRVRRPETGPGESEPLGRVRAARGAAVRAAA